MAKRSTEPVLFEGIFEKRVVAQFDSELRTSDAGATLLGAVDRRVGLCETLSEHLIDRRDQGRVEHTHLELFRHRVFSIALGYADCNDSAHIGQDPAIKLVCGRLPSDETGLASQPSLSRFERGVDGRDLVALGRGFETFVIERLRRRHRHVRLVTIDLDGTVDPAHGQQPFAFYNGYYESWCYLPLLGFLTVDADPEQHLFHARLRPGTARDWRGVQALLRRTVEKLRRTFKKARIRVRLDAGFACRQLLDFFEELRVEYVVGIKENAVLAALSERDVRVARRQTIKTHSTTTLFGEERYKAVSWPRERRLVYKAEVVHLDGRSPRENARYLVTNLRHRPERVWRIYCGRGDSENRIKELKNDLEIDRTSCSSFLANQFRVLLTAAAYCLYQELRRDLRGTELARGLVATLRRRLLKIGATITESCRRVVISMPYSHPWRDVWRRVASRVGALA